jgi:hypothetical protein
MGGQWVTLVEDMMRADDEKYKNGATAGLGS